LAFVKETTEMLVRDLEQIKNYPILWVWPLGVTSGEITAMAKKDIHVVPHQGGWATRKEGAQRVGKHYDTQRAAQDAARPQAVRDRVEVVTHGRDGKIRDSDSYGNDPFPPRDKKH
jgi:hypothetical protein